MSGSRSGFGLAEVVVALMVFTVGALGAAALTAHAARIATGAARYEAVLLQVTTLLDSLIVTDGDGIGARRDRHALYEWRTAADSSGRRIDVSAYIRASADTIHLRTYRPPVPPTLQSEP